jgi:hypothetical protein
VDKKRFLEIPISVQKVSRTGIFFCAMNEKSPGVLSFRNQQFTLYCLFNGLKATPKMLPY